MYLVDFSIGALIFKNINDFRGLKDMVLSTKDYRSRKIGLIITNTKRASFVLSKFLKLKLLKDNQSKTIKVYIR